MATDRLESAALLVFGEGKAVAESQEYKGDPGHEHEQVHEVSVAPRVQRHPGHSVAACCIGICNTQHSSATQYILSCNNVTPKQGNIVQCSNIVATF